MIIGMGTPIQTLPISDAALREVNLVGVFRYAGEYPEAVEILSSKNPKYPDFSQLITHRFSGLDQIDNAFNTASLPNDTEGKVVLKVAIEFSK
jgi:L-iditol 2-dehydrogenase